MEQYKMYKGYKLTSDRRFLKTLGYVSPHEQAKRVLSEIMASEREIYRLQQHIKVQEERLKTTCPHHRVVEEYDDDFHRPRSYVMCRLCGAEVG